LVVNNPHLEKYPIIIFYKISLYVINGRRSSNI